MSAWSSNGAQISTAPHDTTQVGRFRRALGETGGEELLAKTVEAAVSMKAIPIKSFERVIDHSKNDFRMPRCHLKGQEGDALQAVLWQVASSAD